MKKLLLLFLLILAPIFAKEKLTETKTSLSVSAQKPPVFDADYNKGETLIMTEREPVDYDETKIGGLQPYPMTMKLYSIYWNPSNNQYYYVKDGSDLIKTNGLTYKLNPKKEEQVFVKDIKDPYLQFAGYISSNERLYIDSRNKQQYIKTLIPIHDPIEVVPVRSTYGLITLYEEQPNTEGESFPRSPRTGNLPYGGLPF